MPALCIIHAFFRCAEQVQAFIPKAADDNRAQSLHRDGEYAMLQVPFCQLSTRPR